MIIITKPNASEKAVRKVTHIVESKGLQVHLSRGSQVIIIGVVGDKTRLQGSNIEISERMGKVAVVTGSYKLTNKKLHPEDSIVPVGNTHIGPGTMTVMAGPCAIESKEQLMEIAFAIKKAGATFLQGGAYKPHTSPYSFQGPEEERLKYMKEARETIGLDMICEVTSLHTIEAASRYADMFQIGARNMQNFEPLEEAGRSGIPVSLKHGLYTTADEWLNAAEYIISKENPNIVPCEKDIRIYEASTKNTLGVSTVPVIRQRSYPPIIVDPSHATGVRAYVEPPAKAPITVGADKLMIEVHPCPSKVLSDRPQSLTFPAFERLMADLEPYVDLAGYIFKTKQTRLKRSEA